METAKLFYSGNSQAVRLSEDFRFSSDRVCLKRHKRQSNAIVLLPCDDPWRVIIDSFDLFSDDFMETRIQGMVAMPLSTFR